MEFLHKYHNDANKKHKVYLGEKERENNRNDTFFQVRERDTPSDLLAPLAYSSPNFGLEVLQQKLRMLQGLTSGIWYLRLSN